MLCAGINAKDDIVVISVSILLLIVAVAVNLFVRVGIINSIFDVLLQEGDYTVKKKKEAPVVNICGNLFRMVISNRKVGYFMGYVADSRSTFPDSGFNNKNVCEQKRKIEL